MLAVTDILIISPQFSQAVQSLHNTLMPFAYVVCGGALTWIGVMAYHERSLNTIKRKLITTALIALFLINMGDVGNWVGGMVTELEHITGINGNPMSAFVAAIHQKFGVDLSALVNALPGGDTLGVGTGTAGVPEGATVSTYGYEQLGDPTYDSKSAQGIGAFPFSSAPGSLMEGVSFAISPSIAAGLTPGQTVTANLANGQRITGIYADSTAASFNGVTLNRVDIYDPQQKFGNLSGVQVVSITGGSTPNPSNFNVPTTEGDTSGGFAGSNSATPQQLGDFVNSMLHPTETLQTGLFGLFVLGIAFVAAFIMWIGAIIQSILFYGEIAVGALFVPFLLVRGYEFIAKAFILSFFGICLWPLAWIITGLVTVFLISMATNSGNSIAIAGANILGGMTLLWMLCIALWVGFSTVAGPWIISKRVVAGASGVADVMLGTHSTARNLAKQTSNLAYRSSVAGAAARNGSNGSSLGTDRPNYAVKPRA